MKKVGIITLHGDDNYGNCLQKFALSHSIKKVGLSSSVIKNTVINKPKITPLLIIKVFIKRILKIFINYKYSAIRKERKKCFSGFNNNIEFTDYTVSNKTYVNILNNEFDYFVVGSDQIWNPKYSRLTWFDLLAFTDESKKISYAASFGINKLPDSCVPYASEQLKKFKKISVRENEGKKIIKDISGREDVEVLVDPTMLLNEKEWQEVIKRPKQLNPYEKYILCYFLGNKTDIWKREIERISKEFNCKIINILDIHDPFFQTGPSEFLYLEKNAFLICTDSFHSSVFAILFKTPFVVFERISKENENVNSRVYTLLNKFKLQNRLFTDKISERLLKNDFDKVDEILEKEREKSISFLKDALDIDKEGREEIYDNY